MASSSCGSQVLHLVNSVTCLLSSGMEAGSHRCNIQCTFLLCQQTCKLEGIECLCGGVLSHQTGLIGEHRLTVRQECIGNQCNGYIKKCLCSGTAPGNQCIERAPLSGIVCLPCCYSWSPCLCGLCQLCLCLRCCRLTAELLSRLQAC